MQARYSLILKQTDRFAGDFEKTSDGLANTQRRLNAAWEDAQVAIGANLLEPLADILDVAIDLIPVVTGVAGAFSNLAVDAAGVVKPLSDILDVISDTVGKADDLTGGTGFLDSALSQLGKNIISGPRDAFLNLRDAVIDVNEWLSATDEEGIRISKSLSAAGLSMFELTRDTILGAAAMRDFDAAVAGADDELNEFDASAAIQAMRDFITLRQILGGQVPSSGFGGGGNIVGLAHGGTIQPGGSALVGERGPEIISPRGGARITPINGGGGGGTVINVEFSGVVGDPTAVAEQIQDLIELYGRTNNAF